MPVAMRKLFLIPAVLGEDEFAQRSPLALLVCGGNRHGVSVALGTDTGEGTHSQDGVEVRLKEQPGPQAGSRTSERELRPEEVAPRPQPEREDRMATVAWQESQPISVRPAMVGS